MASILWRQLSVLVAAYGNWYDWPLAVDPAKPIVDARRVSEVKGRHHLVKGA